MIWSRQPCCATAAYCLKQLAPRQVYVTVYSDGPTRVLRLSEEPNVSSSQAESSVLDLAARLKQASSLRVGPP